MGSAADQNRAPLHVSAPRPILSGMRPALLWIPLAWFSVPSGCGDDANAEDPTAPSSSGAPATSSDAPAASSDAADETATAAATEGGVCQAERPAIVTDIDATLTLSDVEFIMQIGDGNYDPIEREGAAQLIEAYAQRGYFVLYLTARSEQITIQVTDETAREATTRWLEEHGFPLAPGDTELVLAPMLLLGEDVQAYKAQALMERQAAGLRWDYAYGNATTDIGAYAEAGIPVSATFIIDEHAGEEGTVAVEGEGWALHAGTHLPGVPTVCEEGSE